MFSQFESESDDNLMMSQEPNTRKNSIDDLIGAVDFVNIDDITRTRVSTIYRFTIVFFTLRAEGCIAGRLKLGQESLVLAYFLVLESWFCLCASR